MGGYFSHNYLSISDIIELTFDGNIIINKKNIIVKFNSQAKNIFGYGHDDILEGKNINIFIPDKYIIH